MILLGTTNTFHGLGIVVDVLDIASKKVGRLDKDITNALILRPVVESGSQTFTQQHVKVKDDLNVGKDGSNVCKRKDWLCALTRGGERLLELPYKRLETVCVTRFRVENLTSTV